MRRRTRSCRGCARTISCWIRAHRFVSLAAVCVLYRAFIHFCSCVQLRRLERLSRDSQQHIIRAQRYCTALHCTPNSYLCVCDCASYRVSMALYMYIVLYSFMCRCTCIAYEVVYQHTACVRCCHMLLSVSISIARRCYSINVHRIVAFFDTCREVEERRRLYNAASETLQQLQVRPRSIRLLRLTWWSIVSSTVCCPSHQTLAVVS